jgi:tape measure domain-containing protein
MIEETIAKLVGRLVFDVESGRLSQFMQMLKASETAMKRVGKEAEALSAKLNKVFNVGGRSADKAKLDVAVRRSLDKELQTEVRLSKLKRQQFLAQLSVQKLIATGKREEAFLQSAVLKSQIQSAVLASKQQKALQESIKTDLSKAKLQASAEQSQLRQARLADILRKRQERTIQLQRQAASHATAMQRAEQALLAARERGARQAEKYQTSKVAAAIREQRAVVAADERSQRFAFAAERHKAWQDRPAQPEVRAGFMGLGASSLAIGGITAGFAAVVAAVSALGARLDKRQADASESQTYSNIFAQIGGRNPANAKRAETAFAQMTERYGMANNVTTAGDFRVFMLSQQAKGIAMQKSLDTYATQLAAFRAAGMTKAQQERAVIQLQQVRSVGKADTEDVRTFAEAAPLIKQSIVEAWGQRTGYRGRNLDGAFMKAIPKGGVLPADFEAGFARFVSQQKDTLARQMQSIDAQQTRADNARYLQAQNINSSPELVAAISDRIKAETELTESLGPLREASAQLDTAFMKLAAGFLRFSFGKNDTPEQASKKIDVFSSEQPAIDPNVMFPPKHSSGEKVGDPINRFYNWLTNSPSYEEGPANKVQAPQQNLLGTQFPKLDLSRFETKLSDIADRVGEYTRFRDDTRRFSR